MKRLSARIVQSTIVFVVEAITILIVAYFGPNVAVDSFWSALVFAVLLSGASAIGWWLFIQFFGRLPALLYPVIMFILAPLLVKIAAFSSVTTTISRPTAGGTAPSSALS